MGSPLNDSARDSAELAASLVDRWSRHATRVASRLEGPRYGADDVVADLAATASLVAETGLLLASEALACAGGGTGRTGPHLVESEAFVSPFASPTLALSGPLTNIGGSDSLHPSVVSFRLRPAVGGVTEFTLRADATGHRAGLYTGTVVASLPVTPGTAPTPPRQVPVWIIVA
jgi:hypothetical protein